MPGERQCRCVVWIISFALETHCDPRVLLDDNKSVSKCSTKTDVAGLQQIYVIWYSFCILGKSFAAPFEVQQLPFRWIVFDFKEQKIIAFEEKLLKGLSPF